MQRRPRIKAAANLKSSRRAANKSNSELSKETESEKLLEGIFICYLIIRTQLLHN